MDWISSLLGARCHFCRGMLGDCRRACAECARRLRESETAPAPGLTRLTGGLELLALGSYEGWLRSLVLSHKQNPSALVVAWLAESLLRRLPPDWRGLPLAWVPGRPFSDLHLVERLALELDGRGATLAPRALLARRLRPARPQKSLSLSERRARDGTTVYQTSWRPRASSLPAGAEVLLLDDVVTTGATARGCASLLEARLGLKVRGVLAIAYTRRNFA